MSTGKQYNGKQYNLQLRQTSLYRNWPGELTRVPNPSGRACSRDKKHTDSSYSMPPNDATDDGAELNGTDSVVGSDKRLPGWKSNDEQVRTRLLAAVRSRRQRSWHLVST